MRLGDPIVRVFCNFFFNPFLYRCCMWQKLKATEDLFAPWGYQNDNYEHQTMKFQVKLTASQ